MLGSEIHPLKALLPIISRLLGSSMLFKSLQSPKVALDSDFIPSGITILSSPDAQKASLFMSFRLAGSIMLFKLVQRENEL